MMAQQISIKNTCTLNDHFIHHYSHHTLHTISVANAHRAQSYTNGTCKATLLLLQQQNSCFTLIKISYNFQLSALISKIQRPIYEKWNNDYFPEKQPIYHPAKKSRIPYSICSMRLSTKKHFLISIIYRLEHPEGALAVLRDLLLLKNKHLIILIKHFLFTASKNIYHNPSYEQSEYRT